MTTTGKGNEGAVAVGTDGPAGFDEAWRNLRADEDIQFSEIVLPERQPTPSWFEEFMEWLGSIMQPVGNAMVSSWPVLKWALIIGVGLLILFLLYRVLSPLLLDKKPGQDESDDQWSPEESEALALLEEADRLAREGRFDEATHLLLKRSVGQIAAARPHLVEPSSTARELSADPRLPEAARTAFAVIADRVERSLFALVRLDRDDWNAAREAYAEFALQQKALAA